MRIQSQLVRSILLGAMLSLALVACGEGDDDPGIDSGATDSGAIDSGATDSGATDSGATDSGATDSGAVDSGSEETDAGNEESDAGHEDPDAGHEDPDAGSEPVWPASSSTVSLAKNVVKSSHSTKAATVIRAMPAPILPKLRGM